ncbi:MAG: bifunctional folylpolyglutamate synthase/dihydrofolate synthase [Chloroflexi bacterium]|nr:bifunctional folylpolyglutamate synthase/dihydrofolate synthase [Chloroflexota bacterium]
MAAVGPDEAIAYLLSFPDSERLAARRPDLYELSRVRRLLERLGDPQQCAPALHIAGTKGKGSTAAMVASVLRAAGYRTGLYTSPHLWRWEERIQVDGEPIAPPALASVVERLKLAADSLSAQGPALELSTFELTTAAAVLHFADRAVRVQVLEAGLGGRLDATNVVEPAACAITAISYDHTEVLGLSLEEIAAEKAGVVKPGVPVVSALQSPEVAQVIEAVCAQRGCRLWIVGRDLTWRRGPFDERGQECIVWGVGGRRYDLWLPLLGQHQIENAACAVGALETLAEKGLPVSSEDMRRGMAAVHWPGRLQVLGRSPWFVADGAHNVDSLARLLAALRTYFAFDRLFMVVGTSADKDLAGMATLLAGRAAGAIATRSRHPRAAEPATLAAALRSAGCPVEVAADLHGALQRARAMAQPQDLICATGSLFLAAEVISAAQGEAVPAATAP